jgi:hypothetical protein
MDFSAIGSMFSWLIQMGALGLLVYLIQQAYMQNSGQQNQRVRNPLVPPAPAAPHLPPQPQSSKSKKKKGKQGGQGAAAQEPEVRDQTGNSDNAYHASMLANLYMCRAPLLEGQHRHCSSIEHIDSQQGKECKVTAITPHHTAVPRCLMGYASPCCQCYCLNLVHGQQMHA